MASFRASLDFAGKEYDVLFSTYEFYREVDKKGLVASNVYGGEITVRVQSTEDTQFLEDMLNSHFKLVEGTITYKKTNEDAAMKKVVFTDAYIIRIKETLDVIGDNPMSLLITFSARQIEIGTALHENRWPLN